jgi:hypothetical protein
MSYKKLKNFKDIMKDDDFDYIRNHDNIYKSPDSVSKIILSWIITPDGKEKDHVKKLKEFSDRLTSFYNKIKGGEVPDIKKGYFIVKEKLMRAIALFSEPSTKRMNISRGSIRKFNKKFLYGLSVLLRGLRAAFDPDIILKTAISRDQIARYIKDNTEGLGKKNKYNSEGRNSFLNKIDGMNKEELRSIERLLIRPSFKRKSRLGWTELGAKHDPIRIITSGNKVCFLFTRAEHDQYDAQLNVSPKVTNLSF